MEQSDQQKSDEALNKFENNLTKSDGQTNPLGMEFIEKLITQNENDDLTINLDEEEADNIVL